MQPISNVTFDLDRGRTIYGACAAANVPSSGENPDQARRALYEAVELFLETAAEEGTR